MNNNKWTAKVNEVRGLETTEAWKRWGGVGTGHREGDKSKQDNESRVNYYIQRKNIY